MYYRTRSPPTKSTLFSIELVGRLLRKLLRGLFQVITIPLKHQEMNAGLELPAKATLCHTTVRQAWKADLHCSASFEALLGLKIGRNLSTADLNFSQIMRRRCQHFASKPRQLEAAFAGKKERKESPSMKSP